MLATSLSGATKIDTVTRVGLVAGQVAADAAIAGKAAEQANQVKVAIGTPDARDPGAAQAEAVAAGALGATVGRSLEAVADSTSGRLAAGINAVAAVSQAAGENVGTLIDAAKQFNCAQGPDKPCN